MNIKILVATHKKYWMPTDSVYLPIQVGSAIHDDLGYCHDDTGDNISFKQPNYSELTAIYWAWKNLKADYYGINHYRRYFSRASNNVFRTADLKELFSAEDFEKMLKKASIILPKKRNYFIETRYEQYKNAHNIKDLETCKLVLGDLYPDYIKTFDLVMNKRRGHIMNMFVMRKDLFYSYCDWLFSILFTIEPKISLEGYSPYQQRVFGYLSERLLDVWIEFNHIEYLEANYVILEKVNWPKKVANFLSKKLQGPKEFHGH